MPKRAAHVDPLVPKRPMTAFLKYTLDIRKTEECKKMLKDLGGKLVLKELGARWKDLPEDQKQPYKDEYQEQMLNYKAAVMEYEKEHGPLPKKKRRKAASSSEEDSDSESEDEKEKELKEKEKEKERAKARAKALKAARAKLAPPMVDGKKLFTYSAGLMLPSTRTKRLMTLDKEVKLIARDAHFLCTKATEHFVEWLVQQSYRVAQRRKSTRSRKTRVILIRPENIHEGIWDATPNKNSDDKAVKAEDEEDEEDNGNGQNGDEDAGVEESVKKEGNEEDEDQEDVDMAGDKGGGTSKN